MGRKPTHEAPYRGIKLLDLGQGIASPYCAMLLGVYGAESFALVATTDDCQAGLNAFVEKRTPNYKGR